MEMEDFPPKTTRTRLQHFLAPFSFHSTRLNRRNCISIEHRAARREKNMRIAREERKITVELKVKSDSDAAAVHALRSAFPFLPEMQLKTVWNSHRLSDKQPAE